MFERQQTAQKRETVGKTLENGWMADLRDIKRNNWKSELVASLFLGNKGHLVYHQ